MTKLNLPPFNASVRQIDGATKIFDTLRRKYVALTPEEWVRQHFVHYLIEHRHYSPSLIANEVSLRLNGMIRRCDTVVYSRNDASPLMIIEYKSADVPVTPRVFDQISRYNIAMRVEWLVVSNGMRHYCCHVNLDQQTYQFVEQLPDFDTLQGNSPQ